VKKIITVAKNRNEIFKHQQLTIGVDLGDRISHYCVLSLTGLLMEGVDKDFFIGLVMRSGTKAFLLLLLLV
jgi:hypothetical protein